MSPRQAPFPGLPDAVFLDRDGTLNVKAPEGDYIRRPQDLVLLKGAATAVRAFNRSGVPVYVVTNQRGVSLGLMSQDQVAAVNDQLALLLGRYCAHVDGFFVCPHDHGQCTCRKPLPGLLLVALGQHPGTRAARCWTIGDSESDVLAGQSAGTATVRLAGTGTASAATAVAPSLVSAARLVLRAGT